MSTEASPRPWRVETNRFGQHYVVCESGSGDRVRDYIAGPIQNESDARLIVDAVNERETLFADMKITNAELKQRTEERDRLRDLVKRLADRLETESERPYRVEALIREASAAIGEDAK